MAFYSEYNKTISKMLAALVGRSKRPKFNPSRHNPLSMPDMPTAYSVYNFNEHFLEEKKAGTLVDCRPQSDKSKITWINVDGLKQDEVLALCNHFDVHPLLAEDILSIGQRAKADDMEEQLFCLLPMLTYNNDTAMVVTEQLSLVLGANYVLSFQPDPRQDPFNPLRDKLKNPLAPIRRKTADYVFYCLIDAVVDDYFNVLERLSDRLDKLENEVMSRPDKIILLKLNLLKHEIMVVKRAIAPVREMVGSLWRSDNHLLKQANRKYFKDIYDHIALATEYVENYREMSINLQELYMNQVNTRMNEVMKILTVVTTLLAPATVIGSIFGMNFIIPFADKPHAFYTCVAVMAGISVMMLFWFRKKKWF